MSTSNTFSGTDSYSVADVKAVMQNTYEDIVGFANKQLIDYGRAQSWIEDLTYLLNEKALSSFEIQLYNESGNRFQSYRYDVSVSGLIISNGQSGGISYYEIPSNTSVRLFANLNEGTSNYAKVLRELLDNRGWGSNGSAMTGNTSYERSYASGSLQLKRSVITNN